MEPYRIVYIVNFILAIVLLRFLHNSESDKAPVVYLFLYAILIVTNLVMGILGHFDRSNISRYFYRSSLGLLILLFVFLGMETF